MQEENKEATKKTATIGARRFQAATLAAALIPNGLAAGVQAAQGAQDLSGEKPELPGSDRAVQSGDQKDRTYNRGGKQVVQTYPAVTVKQDGKKQQRHIKRSQIPAIKAPFSVRAASRVDGKGKLIKGLSGDNAVSAILALLGLSLETGEGARIELTDGHNRRVMELRTETFGGGVPLALMQALRNTEAVTEADKEIRDKLLNTNGGEDGQ